MSLSRPALYPLAAPILSKLAARQLLSISNCLPFHSFFSRHSRKFVCTRTIGKGSPSIGLKSLSTASLVKVGQCHKYASEIANASGAFSPRRPRFYLYQNTTYNHSGKNFEHTDANGTNLAEDQTTVPNRTREELLELVDQYDGFSFTDQLPLAEPPSRYQSSDGPYLSVLDNPEDEWPPPQYTWPADSETKVKLAKLIEALKNHSRDPEEIFQLYRALPGPRAPYIDAKARHQMLHHLAVVENKDERSMLRYLSVVDDLKVSAIPLLSSEWNSAISFVARYVTRSTVIELEAALEMWKQMEQEAGVKSTNSTFNILFDVACKAGKFTLAEMVYKEMLGRGLEFDHYHYTSLIFYHGLRRNGDGARGVYRTLVEAGEMVDTTVLNAMISALIRSREENAARNIYERMKRDYVDGLDPRRVPPQDFHLKRALTRLYVRWSALANVNPEKRAEYQRKTIIAPDMQTYRLLITYYSVVAGDLDMVIYLLDDMSLFDLPLHGALFLRLLQGFARHGGVRYTSWTDRRLQNVWRSMLMALDKDASGLYVSKWIAVWGLRAFAKCSGNARALAAWEELKERWEPSDSEVHFVMMHLRILLEAKDTSKMRYDWLLDSM